MGKTLDSYLESSFDEYIENFFILLNLFITKTVELREITPIKGDAMEVNIVFLLKTLTTHYQFTEKYKKKLVIQVFSRIPGDGPPDVFPGEAVDYFVKFFYKEKEVLSLFPQYSFSNEIEKWEILLYMDNLHFGRHYLEKCFEFPFEITNPYISHDVKICGYTAFGSRNLRIKDLIEHFGVNLEHVKYYFYFYLMKGKLAYNYTDEEIEEYKDNLNWTHLLMYYKKINNTFLQKYRKEIVSYMINEMAFSEKNQNKAICYFLAQNKYFNIKSKLKILETQSFCKKDFVDEYKRGKKLISSRGYPFLRYFKDNNYLIIVNDDLLGENFWYYYSGRHVDMLMDLSYNLALPSKMIHEIMLRHTKFAKKIVKKCGKTFDKYEMFRNVNFRHDWVEDYCDYDSFAGKQYYADAYEYRTVENAYFVKKILHHRRIFGGPEEVEDYIPEIRYSERYSLDDYGIDDVFRDEEAKDSTGYEPYRDKFICNFASGRGVYLEKLFLNYVSARKIQKWWKKIYYNPSHPVGKKVMERVWEESKDLLIEI